MSSSRPPAGRLVPLLFRELKRRGVLRAASLYVVGAWVMIQASDVILPAFGFSDRSVATVVVLAVAGFPLVVILSWAYRMGVNREDVPAEAAGAGVRLYAAVGGAVVVGLAVLGSTAWLTLSGSERAVTTAPEADLESVAVLYFTDLTQDPEQAHLGAALTGALIEHLGDVDGLTVISRDGVAPYRQQPVTPDSLARALGVGLLVNGSVMQSGGQVRVSVELTDARRGALLTAIRVDRPAGEPIALVDAVVGEVADSLLARMGREQRLRGWQAGTDDPAAWTLLQRGLQSMERARRLLGRGDPVAALAQLAAADSVLAAAERLDRDFGAATVQRAHNAEFRAMVLMRRGDRNEVAQALHAGEKHASRVLERSADPAAYEVRGRLRELRYGFAPPADTAAAARLLADAERDLRQAIAADARRPRALVSLSSVLSTRGSFDEALLHLEEAYRVDAYQEDAVNIVGRLFTINFELAQDAQAERWCTELQRRTGATLQTAMCQLLLAAWSELPPESATQPRDVVEAALAAEPAAALQFGRPLLDVLLAGVLARAGQRDSAYAALARARAAGNGHPELLQLEAGARVLLGEYDVARALLRDYGRANSNSGALVAGSRRFAMLPANPLVSPRRLQ